MARDFRSRRPPSTGDASLDQHFDQFSDALNQIPAFSQISTTDGPESVETADAGTLAFDRGSSATTFWAKESGTTTTGWSALAFTNKTPEWFAYGNIFITSRETQLAIPDASATTLDIFTDSGNTLHVLDSTSQNFLQSLRSGKFNFSFEAANVDQASSSGSQSDVSFTLYRNNSASSHSVFIDALSSGPGDVSMSGEINTAHDDIYAIWIQVDHQNNSGEDDIGMSTASLNLWLT